jgi:hypothetical protein
VCRCSDAAGWHTSPLARTPHLANSAMLRSLKEPPARRSIEHQYSNGKLLGDFIGLAMTC